MALHPATLPFEKTEAETAAGLTGLEAYRQRKAQADRQSDEAPTETAQPIAGHDGTRFRVPKVTSENLLATDGSGVTQPVSDNYLRSVAEKAFLEDYAMQMAALDPNRGFEVR